MADKLRVVVWGTGIVGSACLKQVLRSKEFELVGVLVYSDSKAGRDAGELFGLPPAGVLATQDRRTIYAAKPDCILYTAKDLGKFANDEDLIEILSRGINVVTSLPYHWLGTRPKKVVDQLRAAAIEGRSTFIATGINPNFVSERLAFAVTALSSDVKSITIEEFVMAGQEPADTLKSFGFGVSVEESKGGPVRQIAEQYFGQSLYYIADAIGSPVNELHYSGEWRVATEPVQALNGMRIEPGEVEFLSHRWEARPDGGPVVAFQSRWYLRPETKPKGVPCEDFYRITIEGRPSVRLNMELRASLADYVRIRPDDPIAPVYYAIANTLLQAVPSVVAAEPGILPTQPPSNSYWKRDLRAPTAQ